MNLDRFGNQSNALESVLQYGRTFGWNTSSFMMTVGCVITSAHFRRISEKLVPIGVPLLIGEPSTGKTTCLEVLIASLGRRKNINRKYFY